MKRFRLPVALTVATLLVACASSGSSRAGGSENVLTYDELLATSETDLFNAIQSLRPRWLRPRGLTSLANVTVVTVFFDGTLYGDASLLRGMQLTDIASVTYLGLSDAMFRYGTMAGSGGSLEIETRR